MYPPGPDDAFSDDTPYTPQHEHEMTLVLDDLEQEGVLDPETDATEVGARILTALAEKGMLR